MLVVTLVYSPVWVFYNEMEKYQSFLVAHTSVAVWVFQILIGTKLCYVAWENFDSGDLYDQNCFSEYTGLW